VLELASDGIRLDGARLCQAEVNDGYGSPCADRHGLRLSDDVEDALRAVAREADDSQSTSQSRGWELRLSDSLPLVALQQVLTTTYRVNLQEFVLVSGSHRREVRNMRVSPLLALRMSESRRDRVRVGFEEGRVELPRECTAAAPSVPLSTLDRDCLTPIATDCQAAIVTLDALADTNDSRTVDSLWAVLDSIPLSYAVGLR
jgi:hypothetical protein